MSGEGQARGGLEAEQRGGEVSKRYAVMTYDAELEKFTPQIGLEPYKGLTRQQLKKAIAKLNRMGYAATSAPILRFPSWKRTATGACSTERIRHGLARPSNREAK